MSVGVHFGVGTVCKHDNAVGVKVYGGWTVVWTLFTDDTARRGYFYPDGNENAEWIAGGDVVTGPSAREDAMFEPKLGPDGR